MRYEDATLQFHPGLNAITGSSDSGKSTVLRAIAWVLYNRPSGTQMCRAGSTETSVTLQLDTGLEVERVRAKHRNAYRLGDTWYDAIATGVPQPISQALHVQLAELGPKVTEMLNISRQLDGPFLLTNSGPEAAKILGNLSGLTRIDQGLASLRPDIGAVRRTIEADKKLEALYTASVSEFTTLEQDLQRLEATGVTLAQAGALQLQLGALRDVLERMEAYNAVSTSVDTQIATHAQTLRVRPHVREAQYLLNQHEELQQVRVSLERLSSEEACYQAELEYFGEYLSRLKQEEQQTLVAAGTCPFCGATTKETTDAEVSSG